MSYIYNISAWKKTSKAKSNAKTIGAVKSEKRTPKQRPETIVFQGENLTSFYESTPKPQLLGKGEDNPKLGKNKRNSYILYLAPAQSGKFVDKNGKRFDTCPNRSTGCTLLCLNESGNPAQMRGKIASRKKKTAFYLYDKEKFLQQLAKEVHRFAKKHANTNEETAFRLNGTSDLPLVWELLERGYLEGLPKNVVFYDYTKDKFGWGAYKLGKTGLEYFVAFSRSETNDAICKNVMAQGGIVAAAFSNVTGQKQWKKIFHPEKNDNYGLWLLPRTWMGYKVLNGDQSDDMMIDLYRGTFEAISNDYKLKGVSKGNGICLGLHYKSIKNYSVSAKATQHHLSLPNGFVIKCTPKDDCKF